MSNKLYLFNNLSEKAKQNALKFLKEPFIEVGEEILDTEVLMEDIGNVLFYEDGTVV